MVGYEKVWFDQILEKTGGEGKSILPLTVLPANIWASSTYRHIDIKIGNLYTRREKTPSETDVASFAISGWDGWARLRVG